MGSALKSKPRLDRDALFTALGNHRRRYVLYACNQADGYISIADVAEQVAAWEYDKPVSEITSDERKRIYTSLQQHHLTRLEEADLIKVKNGQIIPTENATNLNVYLEIVHDQNIPWAIYYICFAVIAAFTLSIAHLEWFPQFITPMLISYLIIILLLVSAAIHSIETHQMKFTSGETPPELRE